jgi:hypothetical protein
MSFIVENKVRLRIFILALFIIAMLGPWTFDLINVPAQYLCDEPFVRLYGDYCGSPVSGFGAIQLIILLPFFSNLLLIGNRNSRRLQTINVIVWAIACLLTLTMFIIQSNRDQFVQYFYLLWGLWLYILLTIGTMIFEILVLRSDVKPSMVA